MAEINEPEQILELPIELVERGLYQPREIFDPELMAATKLSIAEKGQKYPVIVRPITDKNPLFKPGWVETHYELADGERRTRCLRELGAKTVKAIIRDLNDWEMLDYGMTTNDSVPLNPIERAKVFFRLSKEFKKSQEEIAKSYNLKQQQVSEYIRLLELPNDIQEMTARAVITMRHAREILKISDPKIQREVCQEIIETGMSTRKLTEKVRELNKNSIEFDYKVNANGFEQPLDEKRAEIILETMDFRKTAPKEWPSLAPQISSENDKEGNKVWYFNLIDGLAQINAIFLTKRAKNWLKVYLNSRLSLSDMRPEVYMAWCELCIVFPTLILFVIYHLWPLGALFLSCLCAVLLMVKLFEENPPKS
jgi:ParB family chromosome partitioning protein